MAHLQLPPISSVATLALSTSRLQMGQRRHSLTLLEYMPLQAMQYSSQLVTLQGFQGSLALAMELWRQD